MLGSVKSQNFSKMKLHDQLRVEKDKGNVFLGFGKICDFVRVNPSSETLVQSVGSGGTATFFRPSLKSVVGPFIPT